MIPNRITVFFLALILAASAVAAQTIEDPKACEQCGMDRVRFAHSRMVVEYADGTRSGVCSVHCAAADTMKHKERKVVAMKVADYGTKELIEARSAAWVVGGKKKGVMTGVPKWAFASKQDANAFVKAEGGKLSSFDKVLKAARKEVAEMGG